MCVSHCLRIAMAGVSLSVKWAHLFRRRTAVHEPPPVHQEPQPMVQEPVHQEPQPMVQEPVHQEPAHQEPQPMVQEPVHQEPVQKRAAVCIDQERRQRRRVLRGTCVKSDWGKHMRRITSAFQVGVPPEGLEMLLKLCDANYVCPSALGEAQIPDWQIQEDYEVHGGIFIPLTKATRARDAGKDNLCYGYLGTDIASLGRILRTGTIVPIPVQAHLLHCAPLHVAMLVHFVAHMCPNALRAWGIKCCTRAFQRTRAFTKNMLASGGRHVPLPDSDPGRWRARRAREGLEQR